MKILEVRHMGIAVRDINKSLEFYRDLLGFIITTEMDESGNFISSTSIEYFVTDVTPPSFESDELGRGNDYVKIIMSESVYTDADMAGGLNMDDFSLFIVENEDGIGVVQSIPELIA